MVASRNQCPTKDSVQLSTSSSVSVICGSHFLLFLGKEYFSRQSSPTWLHFFMALKNHRQQESKVTVLLVSWHITHAHLVFYGGFLCPRVTLHFNFSWQNQQGTVGYKFKLCNQGFKSRAPSKVYNFIQLLSLLFSTPHQEIWGQKQSRYRVKWDNYWQGSSAVFGS